jgi:hypothetical protein
MLVMFVVLNLACATLELTDAPNFRPSYRLYSWKGALLGAVLSLVTMFALNKDYAIVTCFIVAILFVYISVAATHSEKLSNDWGDVNQGLLFRFTTQFLLRLDVRKVHVKFWQPQILLVSSSAASSTLKGELPQPTMSVCSSEGSRGSAGSPQMRSTSPRSAPAAAGPCEARPRSSAVRKKRPLLA